MTGAAVAPTTGQPGVGTFVRLKLTLLRNGFRRSPWQVVAFVLGAVWALGIVGVVGSGLLALRFSGTDVAGPVVVGGGTLLVLGWALVPLVAFGVDETLDPTRFATFGVARRRLVPGLLLAGLLGLPGLVTALLAVAAVVTFSRGPAATAFGVPALAVFVLTAVAASRATTTAAAALLRRRRTRDAVAVLGGLVLVCFGPLFNVVLGRAGSGLAELADLGRRVAGVASWTPPGFAVAAAADAAAGRWGLAALRLVLAVVVLGLLLAAWALALGPAGTGPAGQAAASAPADERRHPVLDRLPDTPAWAPATAVAVRCARYWRRDPRYLVSAASLVVIPLLLVVLPLSQGGSVGSWPLAAGPAIAFVMGWSLHNDVAYDHSAFALHVATGLRGRDDRAGRVLAAALWQLPLLLVASVGGCLLAGHPELLPAVLGAALALFGASLGVSSVASALVPYPAPAPGDNPFQTPKGASAATVGVQFGTSAVTTVVALPTLVPAVIALVGPSWVGWIALPVGLATGIVLPWVGVVQGGAVLDRRAPEVLARVSSS
ncbi:transporter [Kineococcus sp. NPDC059986]|uniref:transporter n=1 Tax=Kineococcus sp. NPDC059986 TaxID=3155538 RepID=UPI00344C15C2